MPVWMSEKLIAVLWVKNLIESNKPYVSDTYYNDFESSSLLEQKYAGIGSYSVSKAEYKSDNKNIDKISVWYPLDMESLDRGWPMIVVVNASNTRVRKDRQVDQIKIGAFIAANRK